MFERYTETARKTIFYARYAAQQSGGEYIDTEHLLLGVLRADPPLAIRLLETREKVDSIQERIEKRFSDGEKASSALDFPLDQECKRVLTRAAWESGRLKHHHISTEHLLLALLHEARCSASKILTESGITAAQLEEAAMISASTSASPAAATSGAATGATSGAASGASSGELGGVAARIAELMGRVTRKGVAEGYLDLTAAARGGTLSPVIGRESELGNIVRILSRKTRRNPVLIGEPGVGKNTLLHGLAQLIADGAVPANLAGISLISIDAVALFSSTRGGKLPDIATRPNVILCVRGLFDLAGKDPGWDVLNALHVLEPQLARAGLQCIATGTPLGLRTTLEKAEALAGHFDVVTVLPPGEEEAVRIVSGVKVQYEEFHGVVITQAAVETAVSASRWFLRHRQLPDRAIDLIDEAAAIVKLRGEREPRETAAIQKRIRQIVQEMEKAIANHDFDKARKCSSEERQERNKLHRVQEELKREKSGNVVNPEDVVEAVAARAGVAPSVVKSVMQVKNAEHMERVAAELAVQIPLGGQDWAGALAAYLTSCSAEDAEKVAQAIRAAKSRIDSVEEVRPAGTEQAARDDE